MSCGADEGFLESIDLLLQRCIFRPCWAKFSVDRIDELVVLRNIALKGADIFCWDLGLLVKGTPPGLHPMLLGPSRPQFCSRCVVLP